MEIKQSNENHKKLHKKSVVCIGNFDGVHKGHQKLLNVAKGIAEAENMSLCVLTFEPHPRTILFPNKPFKRCMTPKEKETALYNNKVDNVAVITFNKEISYMLAEEFVDKILHKQLGAKHVVVGENFRFGYKAKGDVALLKQNKMFKTYVMELFKDGKGKVYSSSRLREK